METERTTRKRWERDCNRMACYFPASVAYLPVSGRSSTGAERRHREKRTSERGAKWKRRATPGVGGTDGRRRRAPLHGLTTPAVFPGHDRLIQAERLHLIRPLPRTYRTTRMGPSSSSNSICRT
ncbi:hypothetical protein Trydic_g22442 [Trypoxylus dichotomus]